MMREDIQHLKTQMEIYQREMAMIAAKRMIRLTLNDALEKLSFSLAGVSSAILQ